MARQQDTGFLSEIIPILPVMDVLDSLSFYVQKLGFEISFIDSEKSPRYAGVQRDNIRLHLQWHDSIEWEQERNRPMLRIKVQDVRALFQEYKLKGVFHNYTALEEKPWGALEFAFYDPSKNGLVFYHEL